MADLLAVAVRGLSFAAALQAAGIPLFLWLFGDALDRSAKRIATLGSSTAFLGLVLTIAYQLIEPARMAGALQGVLDGSLQLLLLNSPVGAATAVRVLGLALVGFGCLKPSRSGAAVALIGGTLVAASFAFMGHTATSELHWLLGAVLIVHLLSVIFWFGALLPLYLAGGHEDLQISGLVIERFSALAIWLVPLLFAAGVVMAVALLPSFATLLTPYGLLLLGKVGGFALLMGLATLNKWRLGPRIAAGQDQSLGAFRASVLTEWVLIAGVLGVTVTMTSLFSPEPMH